MIDPGYLKHIALGKNKKAPKTIHATSERQEEENGIGDEESAWDLDNDGEAAFREELHYIYPSATAAAETRGTKAFPLHYITRNQ
ncbi:hypothetical protein TWF281_002108 [Arthrobotrys megalospora]